MRQEKKKLSSFDKKVIEVMQSIVVDQNMTLTDGEGHIYTSSCVNVDDTLSITTVKKDDKVIARYSYDYETSEEREMM